jgi:hypothetical protein
MRNLGRYTNREIAQPALVGFLGSGDASKIVRMVDIPVCGSAIALSLRALMTAARLDLRYH